ncbi:MAG TPA: tetratricopeptide repeat protein [bacterium]
MVKKNLKEKDTPFDQHFKNARKFLQNNNLVEAKDELEAALTIKPNDDRALNLIGMVFFKLEDLQKAVDIFKQLIKRNSNVSTLYTNIGLAYIKMEQYDKSIPELKKALEMDKTNSNTHNYLGLAYSKIGEFELAKQEFELGKSPKMVEKMEQKIKEVMNKAALPADIKEKLQEEEAKILASQPEELPKEIQEQQKQEETQEVKSPQEKESPPGASATEKPEETAPTAPFAGISTLEEITNNAELKASDIEGVKILNEKLLVIGVNNSTAFSKLSDTLAIYGELKFSPELKRFKGKETKAVFGSKENPIQRIHGTGRILLTLSNSKPQIFKIEDGHIFISEPKLLSFYGNFEWENGRIQTEGAEDLNLVHFWGKGVIVLETKGELISMTSTVQRVLTVDLLSLLGWYGKLIPQLRIVEIPNPQGKDKRSMIDFKGDGMVILNSASG